MTPLFRDLVLAWCTLLTVPALVLSNVPAPQIPLHEIPLSSFAKLSSTTIRNDDQNLLVHDATPAQKNAPQIFNSIHSSLRQWGSSLQHNGMSFFPAMIPKHTLLYHGTDKNVPPEEMEWLAFEIEHADIFAQPRWHVPKKPGKQPGNLPPPSPENSSLLRDFSASGFWRRGDDERGEESDAKGQDERSEHGYLHIYRTTRELTKLLYIDGQSAAKSSLGTLDTQDFLLLNRSLSDPNPRSDYQRALDLCSLGSSEGWDIEGFIRMEGGFELILCDFSAGSIELVEINQRNDITSLKGQQVLHFEYLRAVEKRYAGVGSGRIKVDYSSMVSSFFYSINLTNPDSRGAVKEVLPRLPLHDQGGLARIRSDLREILAHGRSQQESMDWQGVIDMIVSHYSDRLKFLTLDKTQKEMMKSVIAALLDVFIDYKNIDIAQAEQKCIHHYLQSITPRTTQDHIIHEAVLTVTRRICSTLFDVREILQEEASDMSKAAKEEIQSLVDYLNWTTWVACGTCAYDEVCFVAIWPWGTSEDHFHPSCHKVGEFAWGRGYWDGF